MMKGHWMTVSSDTGSLLDVQGEGPRPCPVLSCRIEKSIHQFASALNYTTLKFQSCKIHLSTFGHTTYRNTGTLLKHQNTCEKCRNALDFIIISILCSQKLLGPKDLKHIFWEINYAKIILKANRMKHGFRLKRFSMSRWDTTFTKLWENDAHSSCSWIRN